MTRPYVHVITTGGTIAATPSGMLIAADLLATIPDLAATADVTVEPFLTIGSSLITPAHWVALAARINALWVERPALSGIVVTHGTDTLEETAYFLDLTSADPRPIVLTGAMRQANALSADGPANLRAAIVVAAAPSARQRGTLVVMNDEIHEARTVTKGHTLRVDAFSVSGNSQIGAVNVTALNWARRAIAQGTARAVFTISAAQLLPRVEIIYSYAGADGQFIATAIATGARGLVIAAFGSGRITQGQSMAIQHALAQGVIVVLSSRVGNGTVEENYPQQLAPTPEASGVILAGDLNPQKARVLLLLALTRTADPQVIQTIFATY